jgi:predicted RNA binding protein YcfA (HicA-like mRNA interferase family)
MPPKVRELKKQLRDAGFLERKGKGSHTNWIHFSSRTRVTLSGNDGSDAREYQEKEVQRKIKEALR